MTCHYENTLPQTKKDAEKMKEMFTQFEYDIHELPSDRATSSNIKKLVKEVASYLHSYNGAAVNRDRNKKVIIFAFSGHGAENQLKTNDGKLLHLHEIVKPLVNPNFVEVDPIPKLFFIDACRGHLHDDMTSDIKGNYCIEYATLKDHKAVAAGPESAWMPVLASTLRRRNDTYQNAIAEVKEQVARDGHQQAQSIDNLTGGKFKLYYYDD